MYSDVYVYILELNGGNFYVGKTNNIARRFNDHKNGRGCAWTRLHGGCKIIEIHNNENLFDEDKHTLDFMNMFGVDKVRGGSFSNIELTEEQKNIIGKSIRNANDLCQECGESGHFINECPSKEETMRLGKRNNWCSRCFRTGHLVKECYAKTNIYGKFI
jgi:hypothetical protein